MDIQKYVSYFHDGSIVSLQQHNKIVELWMESSEILPEWGVDIFLSKNNTIKGKLIIYGIRNISVNNIPIENAERNYFDGEILKLKINEKSVDLLIGWWNYIPGNSETIFEHINIRGDRIEWENIPDLFE